MSDLDRIEYCICCKNPTGRAGKAEDSLYVGDLGPYCETCFDTATLAFAAGRKARGSGSDGDWERARWLNGHLDKTGTVCICLKCRNLAAELAAVREEKREREGCPWCGRLNPFRLIGKKGAWTMRCLDCGAQGPQERTQKDAKQAALRERGEER